MRKPSSFVGGLLLGISLGVLLPFLLPFMLPDRPVDVLIHEGFSGLLWVEPLLLGLPLAGFLVWCWMRRRAARGRPGGDAAPAHPR